MGEFSAWLTERSRELIPEMREVPILLVYWRTTKMRCGTSPCQSIPSWRSVLVSFHLFHLVISSVISAFPIRCRFQLFHLPVPRIWSLFFFPTSVFSNRVSVICTCSVINCTWYSFVVVKIKASLYKRQETIRCVIKTTHTLVFYDISTLYTNWSEYK